MQTYSQAILGILLPKIFFSSSVIFDFFCLGSTVNVPPTNTNCMHFKIINSSWPIMQKYWFLPDGDSDPQGESVNKICTNSHMWFYISILTYDHIKSFTENFKPSTWRILITENTEISCVTNILYYWLTSLWAS